MPSRDLRRFARMTISGHGQSEVTLPRIPRQIVSCGVRRERCGSWLEVEVPDDERDDDLELKLGQTSACEGGQ